MTTSQREAIHQLIRERGDGEKLDHLIAMLDKHRATATQALEIAEAHPGNHILGLVARDARKAIRAMEITLDLPTFGTHGSLGHWGENGQAPRVADLLQRAEDFSKGVAA